jgi:hypothetical protein
MDEHSFDEFIKRKVGDYEDPSYDEGAFASLDKRLTSFQRISWYKQYRTEVVVISSLILFTMLNTFITASLVGSKSENNAEHQTAVIVNNKNMDSLTAIIHDLHLKNETLADELKYVKSGKEINNFASAGYNRSRSQATIMKIDENYASASDANKEKLDRSIVDDRQVESNKSFIVDNNNEGYAITPVTRALNQFTSRPIVFYAPVLKPNSKSPRENIHNKNISAKIKNDIEKHYFAGIGVNVAPHVDGVLNVFNKSRSEFTPRVGVTADWVVSPRLSIETSVDYFATKLILTDHFERCDLPDHNDYWGPVGRATVSTRTLSSPISIKYRQWISPKNELIVRSTFTPYYALNQKIKTDYLGGPYTGRGDDSSISKIQRNEVMNYYTSTAKLSIGIQHLVKERQKLEGSLFYERSLQEIHRHNSMQLYGISLSYWYNLR